MMVTFGREVWLQSWGDEGRSFEEGYGRGTSFCSGFERLPAVMYLKSAHEKTPQVFKMPMNAAPSNELLLGVELGAHDVVVVASEH